MGCFGWGPKSLCWKSLCAFLVWKKRSENLGWNFGVQPIPRVAPRVAPRIGFSHKLGRESHSESCSENAPEFPESCSENGLVTPRVFFLFSKLGWFAGFWWAHCRRSDTAANANAKTFSLLISQGFCFFFIFPATAVRLVSDLFRTRVWCIPGFGAENKSALFQDFLVISAVLKVRGRFQKPRQTPVRTKLRLKRFPKVFHLVAPYCAIPRDYLSDTPLLHAMGFLVSRHGQSGAIPPPPFLSVSPLESMRGGGAIPPPPTNGVSQWYLRDTTWKQGKWVRYPPSATRSRKGITRYGGGYLALGR